jgi:hypothetical protein
MIALAICEIGSIAERRIAMLVDPALSGLPAFLTPRPGLNSGFMIPQVTAAALISENKQMAYPASVDSIPTSANQEDHVSMAAHGARRLAAMVANAEAVIGIELLAAVQGAISTCRSFLDCAGSGSRVLREQVPALDEDRHFHPDMEAANALIRAGGWRTWWCRACAGLAGRLLMTLTIHRGGAARRRLSARRGDLAARPLRPPWLARRDADWWIAISMPLRGTWARRCHIDQRSVIDCNRDPSGVSLYPGRRRRPGPTTTFDGEPPIHTGPDPADIASRRAASILSRGAGRRDRAPARIHPRVVLYDAHSIRSHIPRLFDGACRSSTSAPTAARPVRPNWKARSRIFAPTRA